MGYTGGTTSTPTYRNLGDHTETVDIEFNPDETSYEELLKMFWESHDPTMQHKRQYMSAIFYHGADQRTVSEQSRDELLKKATRLVVTVIEKAGAFYEAEDYHQKYMLRKYPELISALKLSDAELIKSSAAARLNGYIGGFGSVEAFNSEKQTFSLSPDMLDMVRRKIRSRMSQKCQ